MISGYIRVGQKSEAFKVHQSMKDEGVKPYRHTFISLLKACASVTNLAEARRLHVDAQVYDFDSDVFVCNTLISMYGKCGSIVDAENVFTGLSHHVIVSWNAMLTAYVEDRQGDKALLLYRQLHEHGFIPNEQTFLITVQACAMLVEVQAAVSVERHPISEMLIEIAKALHADARGKGYHSNLLLNNTLMSLYGKHGSIFEAENMFAGLLERDVVSWNVMLSAYVEQGKEERCLQFYSWMQREGVCSNRQTCIITLHSCSNFLDKEKPNCEEGERLQIKSLNIGHVLHADACRKGFSSDCFIGSILINLYGKCGSIMEAEDVFNGLVEHDIVCWSAMISAYTEHGSELKALKLFRQMIKEGVNPDQQAFVASLHACSSLADLEPSMLVEGWPAKKMSLEIGQALHADAQCKGFTSDVFVGNTLISLYGSSGNLAEAENAFERLSHRSVVSWNAMLSAYVEQGDNRKALQFYRQMLEEGVCSNQEQTIVITLQACGALSEEECKMMEGNLNGLMSLEIGKALHADASSKGFTTGSFVGNTLIGMYGKCGGISEAQNVFHCLHRRDCVSSSAMLFAYLEVGQVEEALQFFEQSLENNVILNEAILMHALQGCSELGVLQLCWKVHFYATFAGYDQSYISANTLIHTYGTCASMVDAQAVFDSLFQPDVVSWNTCIAGHAQEGDFLASLCLFKEMQFVSIQPDEITFLAVLSVCSHTGFVDSAISCLESMRIEYCITLVLKHFVVMIDLFGRAGDFEKMRSTLLQMPMQADQSIWHCLLSACWTHGNVELAQEAFLHAVALQSNEATLYVLMSNIVSRLVSSS